MRTLFLTHRLPYAPNRGDRIRAFHLLQAIASFSDVHLVSLVHDPEEAAHVKELAHLARVTPVPVSKRRNLLHVVPGLVRRTPLTHVFLDGRSLRPALDAAAARRPDVVLAYCSGMARCALASPLAGLPFVLDMVDVDSCKWASLADNASWPMRAIYRREAKTLGAFEAFASRRAQATLVVTERERHALTILAPGATVNVVPNGIEIAAFMRPKIGMSPREAETVIFCGVMDYPPNEAAVLWFGREVWPLILHERPRARFLVVGSSPTRALRMLAAANPSIEVTGAVPRVQPFLWRAAVSIAPLQVARGIQNKVLEALAAGLPVVATPVVLDGLPTEVQPSCTSAEGAQDFAHAVLALLSLPQPQRDSIVARADLARLEWERRLTPMRGILAAASTSRPLLDHRLFCDGGRPMFA